MLGSLLRLQIVAFRRAPFFGGRVALAGAKTVGLLYAVVTAALLGFLLPDTLSVWAPEVDVLAAVERSVLPGLGALAIARVLFQELPTRGAEAFLLLPVDRTKVARAVGIRSLATVMNALPLVFAIPFAARTVRAEAGGAAAFASLMGVVALVALSHVALVVWKTRLGERPVQTAVMIGGLVAALIGLDVAVGGLVPRFRAADGWLWIVGIAAVTTGLGVYAYRGIVGALYLDHSVRPARRRQTSAESLRFESWGARAFLTLDVTQLRRTRYPRGIVVNAFLLGVALSAVGVFVQSDEPVGLVSLFAVSAVAVSGGQFALPFASGHYDRLLTLPGALRSFVRAKILLLGASVLVLGAVQFALAVGAAVWTDAALADTLPGLAAGVLFGIGVLAPISILGSSLAPKPLDTSDRVMMNYKVQSIPAQVLIGVTSLAALGLALSLPDHDTLALAFVGAAGVAALPLWERALVARLRRSRHSTADRFRATL